MVRECRPYLQGAESAAEEAGRAAYDTAMARATVFSTMVDAKGPGAAAVMPERAQEMASETLAATVQDVPSPTHRFYLPSAAVSSRPASPEGLEGPGPGSASVGVTSSFDGDGKAKPILDRVSRALTVTMNLTLMEAEPILLDVSGRVAMVQADAHHPDRRP